jgi:hypothetical protein
MCDPFPLFYRLWPHTESHEIALNDMLRIGGIEPQRQRPRNIGALSAISSGGHTDQLRKRGRTWQGRSSRWSGVPREMVELRLGYAG